LWIGPGVIIEPCNFTFNFFIVIFLLLTLD
jgi:hypothetical protein